MTTPSQKRASAADLRWYADVIEPALDDVAGLSSQAWDCPAGDSFDAETSLKKGNLESAAGTLRTVAYLLDVAATAQEAEEAAAAASAAAAGSETGTEPESGGVTPPPVPSNVW